MKEIEINGEVSCNQLAAKAFQLMGYEILTLVEGTTNGPDMHVKKEDLIFRVEIKKARAMKRSMAVHPIEEARRHDDLVAVVFPSGYVFIEPMEDYLFNCSDSGTRSFFGIY